MARLYAALVAALFAVIFTVTRSALQASLYTALPQASYDFVVVGGGTAGSLVAAELAAANPAWSVLLLEAGHGIRDGALSEQSVPGGAPDNVAFENIDWGYRVEPQKTPLQGDAGPGFQARQYPIPRGRGLGGSNELNFMLHVRGTPADYTEWEAATGDSRWGAASMQSAEEEYEKRIEFASKAAPLNGAPPHAHALASDWVAAAATSTFGKVDGSYNDPKVARDGGHHFEHAVSSRGIRQSTARQFLLPRLSLPNLDVVVGATVHTVLLNGSAPARATGVSVTLAPCVVPSISLPVVGTVMPASPCLFGRGSGDVGRTLQVTATKEVVLSAGAYATPHILLKSGVGAASELEAAGVRTKVHLPGVGKHLQDHPIVGIKWRLGQAGGAWIPRSVSKVWLGLPSVVWSYLSHGQGILSSSGCDLGYFGASSPEYAGRPDLQMHGMITAGDADFFEGFLHYTEGFTSEIGSPADYSAFAEGLVIAPTLLHAKAQGAVRLRLPADGKASPADGKAEHTDHPVIEYEAFGDPEDVDRLVEGVRRLQRIMAEPAMAAHAPELLHARGLARDFGTDTDAYWREYIKRFGFVVYHPTGTCKMGKAGDAGAVVDQALRVRGVQGLRVADASVMPEITSGNTQVPTAAIAVQMVRILKEELM